MNKTRKILTTVFIASSLSATLTGCGDDEKALLEAAEEARKEAHCEAVHAFDDWADKDDIIFGGRYDPETIKSYTWAMYETASEKDKEKLAPHVDEVFDFLSEIESASKSDSFWEGTGRLLLEYGNQKLQDFPSGRAQLALEEYAENNRCDTAYFRIKDDT